MAYGRRQNLPMCKRLEICSKLIPVTIFSWRVASPSMTSSSSLTSSSHPPSSLLLTFLALHRLDRRYHLPLISLRHCLPSIDMVVALPVLECVAIARCEREEKGRDYIACTHMHGEEEGFRSSRLTSSNFGDRRVERRSLDCVIYGRGEIGSQIGGQATPYLRTCGCSSCPGNPRDCHARRGRKVPACPKSHEEAFRWTTL